MNYTFEKRKDIYTDLWAGMDIRPERLSIVTRQADRIIENRDKYEAIQHTTGVPWYLIGLMHLRESNLNFTRHLHNGDSLERRTVRVPAGRPLNGTGPFTFQESAEDALRQKGLDKIKDWSIERVAYTLEQFNGFGYVARGINSPYLWASTNHYTRGKYIRDHVFSSNTVDTQLGTMAVIRVILDKVGDLPGKPHTEVAIEAPKAEPERPTTKELTKVSRKAWWTQVQNWILSFFGIGTVGERALTIADLDTTRSGLNSLKVFAKEWGMEFLLGLAVVLLVINLYKMHLQKEDIAEGRAVASGDDK